jgi:hypothetical protein
MTHIKSLSLFYLIIPIKPEKLIRRHFTPFDLYGTSQIRYDPTPARDLSDPKILLVAAYFLSPPPLRLSRAHTSAATSPAPVGTRFLASARWSGAAPVPGGVRAAVRSAPARLIRDGGRAYQEGTRQRVGRGVEKARGEGERRGGGVRRRRRLHPIRPSRALSRHLRLPHRRHSRATPTARRVLIPGVGYDRPCRLPSSNPSATTRSASRVSSPTPSATGSLSTCSCARSSISTPRWSTAPQLLRPPPPPRLAGVPHPPSHRAGR